MPKLQNLGRKKQAYTLVEVMLAAAILSALSLGTLSGLLQARRFTEGSIYHGTATTISQGYIEQIKNMEFSMLDLPLIHELRNQGSEDSLEVSPLPDDPEAGDASTDIVNKRLIDINNTPKEPQDDMEMRIVLYIEDISNSEEGVGNARRIALRYSYVDDSRKASREFTNTIYAIRSQVQTF